MNKSQKRIILEGLIGAWRLYKYAREKDAFVTMGGDRYNYSSDLVVALSTVLDLDPLSVSSIQLEMAIDKFTGGAE